MEGYQIFLAVPDGSPYSFTRFGARFAHFGADRIYIDKNGYFVLCANGIERQTRFAVESHVTIASHVT